MKTAEEAQEAFATSPFKTCPICGSERISWEGYEEVDYNFVSQNGFCEECSSCWTIGFAYCGLVSITVGEDET